MAQVDVKWPSEDEEFDTATDAGAEPKKVTVVDHDETDSNDNDTQADLEQGAEQAQETSEEQNTSDTAPELPGEPDQADESAESSDELSGSDSESSATEEQAEQESSSVEPESSEQPEASTDEAQEESPAPETEVEATSEDSAPEPGSSIAPEAPAASEPAATNSAASEAEKPQTPVAASKGGGHMGRNLLFVALILIIGGLGAWSWMLYTDRNNLQQQVTTLKKNPQDEVQRQSKEIISKVDAQINLPQGENPTIANVTDAASAKKESDFFTDAKNGDKVLVYVNAGIAVLYRPSTDRVIIVAPLSIDKQKGTSTPSTNTQTPTNNGRGTNNANTLQ